MQSWIGLSGWNCITKKQGILKWHICCLSSLIVSACLNNTEQGCANASDLMYQLRKLKKKVVVSLEVSYGNWNPKYLTWRQLWVEMISLIWCLFRPSKILFIAPLKHQWGVTVEAKKILESMSEDDSVWLTSLDRRWKWVSCGCTENHYIFQEHDWKR